MQATRCPTLARSACARVHIGSSRTHTHAAFTHAGCNTLRRHVGPHTQHVVRMLTLLQYVRQHPSRGCPDEPSGTGARYARLQTDSHDALPPCRRQISGQGASPRPAIQATGAEADLVLTFWTMLRVHDARHAHASYVAQEREQYMQRQRHDTKLTCSWPTDPTPAHDHHQGNHHLFSASRKQPQTTLLELRCAPRIVPTLSARQSQDTRWQKT